MQNTTGLVSLFIIGITIGFFLSTIDAIRDLAPILVIAAGIALGVLTTFLFRNRKQPEASYDEASQEVYAEIRHDVTEIQAYAANIKQWQLRQQLNLIAEDIVMLLDKVADKAPENRLTTGRFIQGHLDFIINDILPQYIEMQDTPRYFESTEKKMADGHQAIRTLGTFLHNRIVQLEIADDMRYAIAIEMLRALDAYNNGEVAES